MTRERACPTILVRAVFPSGLTPSPPDDVGGAADIVVAAFPVTLVGVSSAFSLRPQMSFEQLFGVLLP